jgi:hypothetical protein
MSSSSSITKYFELFEQFKASFEENDIGYTSNMVHDLVMAHIRAEQSTVEQSTS